MKRKSLHHLYTLCSYLPNICLCAVPGAGAEPLGLLLYTYLEPIVRCGPYAWSLPWYKSLGSTAVHIESRPSCKTWFPDMSLMDLWENDIAGCCLCLTKWRTYNRSLLTTRSSIVHILKEQKEQFRNQSSTFSLPTNAKKPFRSS
jgi:hypothetical protein